VQWVKGEAASPAGLPPLPPRAAATQRRDAANGAQPAKRTLTSRACALLATYAKLAKSGGTLDRRTDVLIALLSGPPGSAPPRGNRPAPPAGLSASQAACVDRAMRILAGEGPHVSARATRALNSTGTVLSPLDPGVAAELRALYPPAEPGPVQPGNFAAAHAPRLSTDAVKSLIASMDPTGGPDSNGWKPSHLQGLLGVGGQRAYKRDPGSATSVQVLEGVAAVVNDIASGAYCDAGEARELLTTLRGVALRKPNGKARPIGITPIFTKIAAMLLMRSEAVCGLIAKATGPTDLGIGVKGGVEAVPTLAAAYLKANPKACLLTTDAVNAFNSIYTSAILDCGLILKPLKPFLCFLYGKPITAVYRDPAQPRADPLVIPVCRGTIQGSAEGSLICSAVLRPCVDTALEQVPGARCVGDADDRTFLGLPGDLAKVLPIYAEEIGKRGISLNPSKMSLVCGEQADRAAAKQAAEQLGVTLADGAVICGAPVGTNDFINGFLAEKFDAAIDAVNKVRLMAQHAAETNHRSMERILQLTRHCVSPALVMYLLGTTPTELVLPHARRFDDAVFQLVLTIARVPAGDPLRDTSSPGGARALQLCGLGAAAGGLGVGSAVQLSLPRRAGHFALVVSLAYKHDILDANDAPVDVAFPDLAPLLEAVRARAVPAMCAHKELFPEREHERAAAQAFLTLTVQNAADGPRYKGCHALNRIFRAADARILAGASPTKFHEAWLFSLMNEGAQHLASFDNSLDGLSPQEVAVLVRQRLGLPPHPATQTSGPCSRSGCKQNETPAGYHYLSCHGPAVNGHSPQGRHAAVKAALRIALGRAARLCGQLNKGPERGEPRVGDFLPTRAGYVPPAGADHDKDARGDILCRNLPYGPAIFDTVVSAPAEGKPPGAAAAAAYNAKVKKYTDRYDFKGRAQLFPIAIEAGGRWHPASREHVRTYLSYLIGPSENWTAFDKVTYNTCLRDVVESVGRALASYQASFALASARVAGSW